MESLFLLFHNLFNLVLSLIPLIDFKNDYRDTSFASSDVVSFLKVLNLKYKVNKSTKTSPAAGGGGEERERGRSHISQKGSRPLLEKVQALQLQTVADWAVRSGASSRRGVRRTRGQPRGLLLPTWPWPRPCRGARSRLTCVEKSESEDSGSTPSCPSSSSSSSVLFLFLSSPTLGEKKERMSCCLSFSNCKKKE